MDWRPLVERHLSGLGLELSREREIVEELAQDLEQRHTDALARGLEPARAEAETRAELAALAAELRVVERPRRPALLAEQTGREDALVAGAPPRGRWLGDLRQDLRFGARALAKRPLFAAVAVLTLALGVGAATAIFGILDAVLLRPLPYAEPARLVHVFETQAGGEFTRREASWADFLDWRAAGDAFVELGGYNGGSVTLTATGRPDRVPVVQVTDNFFDLLGVAPRLGRGFLPGESGPDAARVVVLTHGAWQSRFGGDGGVIGRTVALNGEPHTIVGVLPREFHFPLRGNGELWIPIDVSPAQVERRYWHWLDVVGRLAPGVEIERASERLGRVAGAIAELDPEFHDGTGIRLVPLRDEMVGGVRPAMIAATLAVGFLVLVACSNLASLMLARAAERRRELAVRGAIGARPGRLLRQLLAESSLLAALGGAGGLALAFAGTRLAVAALPAGLAASLPHLAQFRLHLPSFAFSLGLTAATTLIFGLAPAARAARVPPVEALGDRRATGSLDRNRLGRALVVAEIASALVLLLAAGLVGKSLTRLLETPAGFDTRDLLTLRLSPPVGWNREDDELRRLHRELLASVERLPGVTGVATVTQLPLTGRGNTGSFRIDGRSGDERPEVNLRGVSDGYFRVLGVPLLAGRAFTAEDRGGSPRVVMVNRTLARRVFGDQSPLGRRISFAFFDGEPWWEIVGVVGDERVDTLDGEVTPIVYFSETQEPNPSYSLVVRSGAPAAELARRIEAEAHAIDSQWPVYAARTMTETVDRSLPVFLRRYLSRLLGAFAAVAAAIAAVGVYGVVALSIAQRRREIGIRVALGARASGIASLVIGQAARLAAAGIAAGVVAALAASRLLGALLYRVSPADPSVLAATAAALAALTLVACAAPLVRALRVDPVEVLRAE